MTTLSSLIKEQQFRPGFLGIFVNPFYFMRKGLWLSMQELAPKLSGKLLDVGCGEKPYRNCFTGISEYVGLEYDSPEMRRRSKADAFYDGRTFPFSDGSFDCVLATEVLEHIFEPDAFLSEVRRVLKPGGAILLTCPFMWDEHEQPRDYARYSSFGLKSLLEKNGFVVVEQRKTNADARALFQIRNCYRHKGIRSKSYKIRLLRYLLSTAPVTAFGLLAYRLMPKNPDLYLSNVVLAQKGLPS